MSDWNPTEVWVELVHVLLMSSASVFGTVVGNGRLDIQTPRYDIGGRI